MSTPRESAPSEEFAALHAQVRHYQSELTERDAVIAKHEAMIEHLQEQVRLLLAQRFAPSSEKIPDGQLGLFNEAEATAGEEPESAPATEVGAHRRGTPKRAPIPEALPRIDIEHRLPEDERTCPHHGVELETLRRGGERAARHHPYAGAGAAPCPWQVPLPLLRRTPSHRRDAGAASAQEPRQPRTARLHRHGEVRRCAAAVSPVPAIPTHRR